MASSQRSRSVAARLADLEQLVSAQQREIARLRATPTPLAAHPALPPALPTAAAPADVVALPDAAPRDERPTEQRRNSRRALLKLGGAAAAAGVAAVAASATELAHPGTAQARALAAGTFSWSGGTPAVVSDGSLGSPGIHATSDTASGVWGESLSGTAITGYSMSGRTVEAITSSGDTAIYGFASLGYGALLTGGKAALRLIPGIRAGAPSTLNDKAGELNVDSNGALWYCYSSAGVTLPPFPIPYPGSWIRLSGPRSGVPGGALCYLPAPIRLFDSRSDFGQGVPLPVSKGALAGQSTTTIQVTGTIPVPSGATGVFGNLTVSNTQGGGDLILYPSGASQPNASNINYVQGQTIANAFNVGLSSGGAMDLFVHVSSTDVIIDIAGYVL